MSLEGLYKADSCGSTPFSRRNPGFGRLRQDGPGWNLTDPGGGPEGLSEYMLIIAQQRMAES